VEVVQEDGRGHLDQGGGQGLAPFVVSRFGLVDALGISSPQGGAQDGLTEEALAGSDLGRSDMVERSRPGDQTANERQHHAGQGMDSAGWIGERELSQEVLQQEAPGGVDLCAARCPGWADATQARVRVMQDAGWLMVSRACDQVPLRGIDWDSDDPGQVGEASLFCGAGQQVSDDGHGGMLGDTDLLTVCGLPDLDPSRAASKLASTGVEVQGHRSQTRLPRRRVDDAVRPDHRGPLAEDAGRAVRLDQGLDGLLGHPGHVAPDLDLREESLGLCGCL